MSSSEELRHDSKRSIRVLHRCRSIGDFGRDVQHARDAAEHEEARVRARLLGMGSEQQHARPPRGHEHEEADQHARALGRKPLEELQPDEARRQQQNRQKQ